MTEFNDKQIQILQVAEKLFAEKGFDGTSIREISKDAQINVAMVSYYFGSKEKLLESLILFRTNDLKLQLESLFKQEYTPLEKIEKFIELYISIIATKRDIYQILHFEISSKKRDIDLGLFTEVKKANLLLLTKIINEGQAQGIFKMDINIALIIPTVLGTFFHFHGNKPFFEELFELDSEEKYNQYIKNELTKHIQQTIKSLLLNENK